MHYRLLAKDRPSQIFTEIESNLNFNELCELIIDTQKIKRQTIIEEDIFAQELTDIDFYNFLKYLEEDLIETPLEDLNGLVIPTPAGLLQVERLSCRNE